MFFVTDSVTVMYDTVKFSLLQHEAGCTDFLSEIPYFLEDVSEHVYPTGVVLAGNLGGLRISLTQGLLKVYGGSLCKWYLGDNFQTMVRGDAQKAVEKLSDSLHLPMSRARVSRIDVAQNIIVKHPLAVYLSHFGELKWAKRLPYPDGLLYKTGWGEICFYDKVKERKDSREPIPAMYDGRNVIRCEQRYTNRIASRLGVPAVTGALLSDEAFYMRLYDNWKDTYTAIQKLHDISLNFEIMKTKQQLYRLGVLALVERAGGELQMLGQINEAQQKGDITKKQAHDLRKTVKDVCTGMNGLTVPNEAIQELDKKVIEAAKFYR